MKKTLFAALSLPAALAAQTVTLDSTTLSYRTVIDGLDVPWEIIWGPDNWIWTTERYGMVSRIDPVTGVKDTILDLSSVVYQQYESGLLGMILHPDFAQTPHVFLAYTYLDGADIKERLVRYSYDGTDLVNPDTLLDNIVGYPTHVGARLLILPDNTLLMTTGDAHVQAAPQDINHLSGKVLRMNLDGSVPADNPIPGSLVWTWGHRNPQGLCMAPNGRLYLSEHGPTSDDELQILAPAQNYGWPDVAGYCDTPPENAFCADSTVIAPIAAWTPTIAPSDLLWYDHPAIPEFKDKLLMTVLKAKHLVVFELNPAGDAVVNYEVYLPGNFNRLRDICMAPDGRVFLATNGQDWSNTDPFTHEIIELKNDSYTGLSPLLPAGTTMQLLPNPVQIGSVIRFQMETAVTADLHIHNLLGQSLMSQQGITTATTLPVHLPAGVYVYTLRDSQNRVSTGKLIIYQ